METRKVQMTGGASLMITLPKEWTVSAGVKKNDTLNLYAQTDGSLLISSKEQKRPNASKRIKVDEIKDNDLLFRVLVGAYMSGYSTIEAVSSSKISGKALDVIENMTQTAIGLEIMEENDNGLLIKDLVDPSEMRMDRTTERMRSLVQSMLVDAITSIRNSDSASMVNVISRDSDVDRLEWLVARQTNMVLNDVSLCRRIGMDQKEMVTYHTICKIIERIGDHVVTLSENARILMENSTGKELMDEIVSIGEELSEIFADVVKAWSRKDMIESNEQIKECQRIVNRCKNIDRLAAMEGYVTALPAALIAGSLRRISEYSMDIAENAINIAV